MGLRDSISSAFERGSNTVQSGTRKTQLNIQLNDLMKKRHDLAAQLGASLYETIKSTPELSAGREGLIQGIEDIDRQRAEIQAELVQLESEKNAQKEANKKYTCPQCGTTVTASAQFCSGCGKPVSEIIAESASIQNPEEVAAGTACPECGQPIEKGDMFCGSCGAKLQ